MKFLLITVMVLNFIDNLLASFIRINNIIKLLTCSHMWEWFLLGEKELEFPVAHGFVCSLSALALNWTHFEVRISILELKNLSNDK